VSHAFTASGNTQYVTARRTYHGFIYAGVRLVTASLIQAGFPSPAEDLGVKRIDILEKLTKYPQSTHQITLRGESMRDAGIFDRDVILIDRAISPRNGHSVVAIVDK
jgi:SOS-response transcriptional repressor LexA